MTPIIVFAYNRPNLLKMTIDSLLANQEAAESDLFVFSDGAKNEKDKIKVDEVRQVIKNIAGFKSVTPVLRSSNMGLANSVIEGVNEIINNYNSVIVVEDDLKVSTNFLSYMNGALKYYEAEKTVFSITGYSLPLKRKSELTSDIFFSPRAGSWGWATWQNRWQLADWEIKDFNDFRKDKSAQKKFNIGGEDLTPMLKAQMKGYIDSWAIRWCYTLFKNHGLCVYPKTSKVNLIEDTDGGTHVKNNSMFQTPIDNTNMETSFTLNYTLDNRVLSEMNSFMKPSLIRKVINHFKYDFMK